MKNLHKLLLTSAFIFSGAASYASSNGHFYVGAQVGLLHGEPSGNLIVNDNQDPPVTATTPVSFSENNIAFGIKGGYRHLISYGTLALEGFYNLENSSFKKDFQSTVVGAFQDLETNFNLKKTNTFGISIKNEWALNKIVSTAHISLSLLTSQFNASYGTVDTRGLHANDAQGKQSRYLWAFAPGFGATYNFKERLSLTLDYQYRFYQEWNLKNVNDNQATIPAGLSGNIRMRDQVLMMGITYRLGRI